MQNFGMDTQFDDQVMNVGVVEIKEVSGEILYFAIGDDFTDVYGQGKSAEDAMKDLETKMDHKEAYSFVELHNVLN